MDPGASATAKAGCEWLKRMNELASVAQEVDDHVDQGSEMERCGVIKVCLLFLYTVILRLCDCRSAYGEQRKQ